MTARVSTTLRNAMWDAVRARFDGRKVEFRTGSRPSSPSLAATGTLLATCTLGSPAFGSASSGGITANPITGDLFADTSGVIGYLRVYETDDSTGGLDLTAGLTGSGEDVELPTLTVAANQPIQISSFTILIPNP